MKKELYFARKDKNLQRRIPTIEIKESFLIEQETEGSFFLLSFCPPFFNFKWIKIQKKRKKRAALLAIIKERKRIFTSLQRFFYKMCEVSECGGWGGVVCCFFCGPSVSCLFSRDLRDSCFLCKERNRKCHFWLLF